MRIPTMISTICGKWRSSNGKEFTLETLMQHEKDCKKCKKIMNLIKKRIKQKAICDKCQSPDYTMTPSEVFEGGKPNFRCNSCGNHWQYGYDGGKYAELANVKDSDPSFEMTDSIADDDMPDGAYFAMAWEMGEL